MSETFASGTAPAVSIVIPVRNEADNIAPLVEEIAAVLDKNLDFELIYVNDGSTDRTEAQLSELMAPVGSGIERCDPRARSDHRHPRW